MRNKPNKKPEQEPEASRSIVIKPDPNGKKIKDLTEEERNYFALRIGKIVSDALKASSIKIDADVMNLMQYYMDNINALEPYILQVLQENPQAYKNISSDDFINNLSFADLEKDKSQDVDDTTAEIIKKAQQKKRAAEARAKQKENAPDYNSITNQVKYKHGPELETTTTKFEREFFSAGNSINALSNEINGQQMINFNFAPEDEPPALLMTTISRDEQMLNAFGVTDYTFDSIDQVLADVTTTMYLEGNTCVSVSQIWREMGYKKAPNSRQYDQLLKLIAKGAFTNIRGNDKAVLEYYKKPTDKWSEFFSPVIPCQIKLIHSKANGNIIDATIYLNGVSPFFTVADPIKQRTKWNKDILRLYTGSRTTRYWRVLDYLMWIIGWQSNNVKAFTIDMNKLHQKIGDKNSDDRRATKKMVYDLIDQVFIPLQHVKARKEDSKGNVIITFNNMKKAKELYQLKLIEGEKSSKKKKSE